MMKSIAIDFDGVIHKYSKGWHDGTIYDEPMDGAFDGIAKLMENNAVFVLSTRSPWQIKKWLDIHLIDNNSFVHRNGEMTDFKYATYGYYAEVIWWPWIKFWNKRNVLGITNRKLPAETYIDDRGFRFTSWSDFFNKVGSPG